MSWTVLGMTVLTVTVTALAQMALKLAVIAPDIRSAADASSGASQVEFYSKLALSPMLWAGLVLYGVSVLMWLWVLSKVDLSVAYPFVGLSFALTFVFGVFVLGEDFSMIRLGGTALIVLGCVMVSQSA